MAKTLDKLEQAILDLGVEVFRLKSDLAQMKNGHERFMKVINGLRNVLDEKGLICTEDFETAVDLSELINNQSSAMHDSNILVKKASH